MNSLLTTLKIISSLAPEGATAANLQAQFDMSIATLKRHLNEARELGADIQSVKIANASTYILKNHDAISKRLNRWIELETTRDLKEVD